MNNDTSFKINITGPGLDLNQTVTASQISRIIPLIIAPSSLDNYTGSVSPQEIFPKLSIREYLNEKKPQTNAEKILVFAKYLSNYQRYKYFSIKDLKLQFTNAYEPTPKNFSRDFNLVLKSSWLTESNEEIGKYLITNSGEKRLEEPFRSEAMIVKTNFKNRKQKKVVVHVPVRDEVSNLKVMSDQRDLYSDITKKADKVLWILSFALDNKITELNTKEIEFISKKLGDKINAKDVHILVANYKKSKYIHVIEVENYKQFEISSAGKVFLKSGEVAESGQLLRSPEPI